MSKKRHRRDRAAEQAESFTFGAGTLTRHGRFITFERNEDQGARRAAAQAFAASAQTADAAQPDRHEKLVALMREIGPYDLLARASATYLSIDPNTYKEWEDDRHSAHIEYLALQALAVTDPPTPTADPVRAADATAEAMLIVREMFDTTGQMLIASQLSESLTTPERNPPSEYAMRARLESLTVRGAAYEEHAERVIRGVLAPLSTEIKAIVGFDAEEALKAVKAIPQIVDRRISPRFAAGAKATEELLRQLKRARRGKADALHFAPNLLRAPFELASKYVTHVALSGVFMDAEELLTVSAEDVASAAEIATASAEAILEAMTCAPSNYTAEHHWRPGGAHPLTTRPILRTGHGYILPVPPTAIEKIRPLIEDLLEEKGSRALRERYRKGRANFVEGEAARILQSALPRAESWTATNWYGTEDSKGELDGLVSCDILTLRLQCKAGRVSAPSRRGARDRMATELKKLVIDAAEQHASLAAALKDSNSEQLGFNLPQSRALNSPMQVEVIVTLDDITIWSTEAHKLREVGAFKQNERVPWVLSLTDLMAVTDLLNGAQLAHYIVRRQRLEQLERVSAHDELDWVGHYIHEGLHFEGRLEHEGEPVGYNLLSYTEPIDSWYFARAGLRTVPTPKPHHDLPLALDALIRKLEFATPPRWLAAALCLLEGDEQSLKQWAKMITHSAKRAAEVGWSNSSQVFFGRYGVTLFIVRSAERPEVVTRCTRYVEAKLSEIAVPHWVAICEGRDARASIVIAGQDAEVGLSRTLLNV